MMSESSEILKIAIVNSIIPHPEHDVASANVVIFELMRSLAQIPGFQVHFQKIDMSDERPANDMELAGVRKMRDLGIVVHEPLRLPPIPPLPASRTLDDISLVNFHPACVHSAVACDAVEALGVDVIIIPWSEWVTALLADAQVTKFAYYGNADPKVFLARSRLRRRFGGSEEEYRVQELIASRFHEVHMECMRKYHILGNVAQNDARYYKTAGHPNAFYIQNLWINRFGDAWESARDAKEQEAPAKIIASLGNLAATANSHGLEYIVTQLLPEVRRALSGMAYELHIVGKGEPWPALAEQLRQPEFRMRGFVDDIDHELLSAPIFLNVNNATDFKVGHTRYLHAWSLGACVVAHRDAALSMPEIRHGENALLGGNAAEIADHIGSALLDRNLRRRLGRAGFVTQQSHFTSDAVAAKVAAKIRAFIG